MTSEFPGKSSRSWQIREDEINAEYTVRDYAGMSGGEYALGIVHQFPVFRAVWYMYPRHHRIGPPVVIYAMKTPAFSQELDRE